MIIAKERLLPIGGLAISGIVDKMDAAQYEEYCKALSNFADIFPEYETVLRKSFVSSDFLMFSSAASSLLESLKKIHATKLEQSCSSLLEELSCQKYTIVEAHLTYLMAEISALSIDIQMAQRGSGIPAARSNSSLADNTQKSILAVDDVSLLLFSLKSILQNTNYKFVGVNSGEAALKYVEKYTPDLFILDIEMPGMNGYDLTRRLRRRGQTAPIIFLTGNASVGYVRKAMELGAADFIVKPVNKEQVLDKITRHIN